MKQKLDVERLLQSMTLEEKIGQLNQVGPSLVGAFDVPFEEVVNMLCDGRITKERFNEMMASAQQDFHEDDLRAGRIGSYNGIADAGLLLRLQKIAVEETRLGIPLLFGYDVVHGLRTVTPIPLGESCAWDPELWQATARMAAEEASAAGIGITFAPMVDVSRDARWGRIAESAGEDTLLNARYGAAKVRGFQTDDLARTDAVAACAKHFAGYGAVEAGRDYSRVDMSEQRLREEFLPPFRACVEAGVAAVMPAFNDLSGVPCTANSYLLRTILRREWGFEGMTVSDANAIAELVSHGVAADRAGAAKLALEAGLDMDMTSGCYSEALEQLAVSGHLDMEALDRAVLDVLRTKQRLGLFDNPYQTSPEREAAAMLTTEHRALAYRAACESAVLLKNDGVLPFTPETRLGVMGPLADEAGEMMGTWALKGDPGDCISLVRGLAMRNIPFQMFETAEQALASDCTAFVVAVGERKAESGEAASKADLTLPADQQALIAALAADGRPVAVVLFSGRPLVLGKAQQANAILVAWHPGVEAGTALADLLIGAATPSGKLTATFPAATGQCPIYYAHLPTGRPSGASRFTAKYLDVPAGPAYPFGWGLSYTTFAYRDLALAWRGKNLEVEVTVENTGARPGVEVAQCYLRDPVARRARPVKQLVDFARVCLAPGESRRLHFSISPEARGYYDTDLNFLVEDDGYEVQVGGNAEQVLRACAAR